MRTHAQICSTTSRQLSPFNLCGAARCTFVCGNKRRRIVTRSRESRFLNSSRKTHADAICNTKHQFECRVPQPSFYETEHGLRYSRALGNGVLREFAFLPFLLQESDDLLANCFVMSNRGHDETSQILALDTYFAIVKYCALRSTQHPFPDRMTATNREVSSPS